MVYSLLFSLPAPRCCSTARRSGWARTSTSTAGWPCARRCSGPRTATAASRRSALAAARDRWWRGLRPEHVNVADQRHDPESLLSFMKLLVRRYRESPELGWGKFAVLDQPHATVLAHECALGRPPTGRRPQPRPRAAHRAADPRRLRQQPPCCVDLLTRTPTSRAGRPGPGRGRARRLRLPLAAADGARQPPSRLEPCRGDRDACPTHTRRRSGSGTLRRRPGSEFVEGSQGGPWGRPAHVGGTAGRDPRGSTYDGAEALRRRRRPRPARDAEAGRTRRSHQACRC